MSNVSGNIISRDCLVSANVQIISTLRSVVISKRLRVIFIWCCVYTEQKGYIRKSMTWPIMLKSFGNHPMWKQIDN